MKWFYITALAAVGLLVASPMFLLPWGRDDADGGNAVSDVYSSPIKSIDPATCGDTASSQFQAFMYEGLYHYHYLKRPAGANVICQLAAEMPVVSNGGRTYRIKLRPGVKYHRNPCFGRTGGGEPATRTVRADDFILAFKRIADYYVNTGLAWAFVTRIKGLKAFRRKTEKHPATVKPMTSTNAITIARVVMPVRSGAPMVFSSARAATVEFVTAGQSLRS